MRLFNELTKEEKKSQGVYMIHVLLGDEDYAVIGSGFLGDRMSGNPSKLRRNVHGNSKLQEKYNTEGSKCYVEAIQTLIATKQEARKLEKEYVNHFRKVEGLTILNDDSKLYVEKDFRPILSDDDVREIRKLADEGKFTLTQIGEMFNVSYTQVDRIKKRVQHKNVI